MSQCIEMKLNAETSVKFEVSAINNDSVSMNQVVQYLNGNKNIEYLLIRKGKELNKIGDLLKYIINNIDLNNNSLVINENELANKMIGNTKMFNNDDFNVLKTSDDVIISTKYLVGENRLFFITKRYNNEYFNKLIYLHNKLKENNDGFYAMHVNNLYEKFSNNKDSSKSIFEKLSALLNSNSTLKDLLIQYIPTNSSDDAVENVVFYSGDNIYIKQDEGYLELINNTTHDSIDENKKKIIKKSLVSITLDDKIYFNAGNDWLDKDLKKIQRLKRDIKLKLYNIYAGEVVESKNIVDNFLKESIKINNTVKNILEKYQDQLIGSEVLYQGQIYKYNDDKFTYFSDNYSEDLDDDDKILTISTTNGDFRSILINDNLSSKTLAYDKTSLFIKEYLKNYIGVDSEYISLTKKENNISEVRSSNDRSFYKLNINYKDIKENTDPLKLIVQIVSTNKINTNIFDFNGENILDFINSIYSQLDGGLTSDIDFGANYKFVNEIIEESTRVYQEIGGNLSASISQDDGSDYISPRISSEESVNNIIKKLTEEGNLTIFCKLG